MPLVLTPSEIRQMREARDLSQRQVARALSCSGSLWRHIESGRRRLRPELCTAYLAYLETCDAARHVTDQRIIRLRAHLPSAS